MNFKESEAYLLSLGNEVETMKLGLENIRKLINALGNPQNNYKKVQVAGTNGKGSVCAFLNSICLQAGIKTGLYTSPHLVSITERIKVDGEDISETDFAKLSTLVRETSERLVESGELETVPTYFEQVTAMALVAFAEAKVELAILETGLGGRFDAVTAANADVVAITRIDLDHQEYLGETIQEIAAEKAAIIHSETKVVALHQSREAEQAIVGRCREVGIKPIWATRDTIKSGEDEVHGYRFQVFTFTTEKTNYPRIEMKVLGKHQSENASLAIAAAEVLQDQGFALTQFDICIGLETAEHPGRLEWIGQFLLDGAHNPAGAKALRLYLDETVKRPITLIWGAMREKAVAEMAEILFPTAEKVLLTRPKNSRALSAKELAKVTPKMEDENFFLTDSVSEAVHKARQITLVNGVVLVTGSLYLVGEVRQLLLGGK